MPCNHRDVHQVGDNAPSAAIAAPVAACLAALAAALAGCAGTGKLSGKVTLPVGDRAGRPTVANDKVCGQVEIVLGRTKRYACSFPGSVRYVTRFEPLLVPLKLTSSVYDAATATCPYAFAWPVGDYTLRAYYVTDNAAEGAAPIPTWDPVVGTTDWISTDYFPHTFVKDVATQRDLALVRGPATLPTPALGACKEVP